MKKFAKSLGNFFFLNDNETLNFYSLQITLVLGVLMKITVIEAKHACDFSWSILFLWSFLMNKRLSPKHSKSEKYVFLNKNRTIELVQQSPTYLYEGFISFSIGLLAQLTTIRLLNQNCKKAGSSYRRWSIAIISMVRDKLCSDIRSAKYYVPCPPPPEKKYVQ